MEHRRDLHVNVTAHPYAAWAAQQIVETIAVDRDIVRLRCRILLLYRARELRAHNFEFIDLTWVELRGFEPLTSCMPSAGSTSTRVCPRRSPSQSVRTGPAESAPVAVLSRCTDQPGRLGLGMSA